MGVSQPDAREHGVILAKETMGCDVDKAAALPLLLKNFGGGLSPKKDLCIRKNGSHRVNLIGDAGRGLVRNPQQKRGAASGCDTIATERINTGAWSIRHGKRIDQVSLSIKQGAEGQMVQYVMGNKGQMTCLQARADRRNQFIVKLAQMLLCRTQKGLFKG